MLASTPTTVRCLVRSPLPEMRSRFSGDSSSKPCFWNSRVRLPVRWRVWCPFLSAVRIFLGFLFLAIDWTSNAVKDQAGSHVVAGSVVSASSGLEGSTVFAIDSEGTCGVSEPFSVVASGDSTVSSPTVADVFASSSSL